MPKYEPGELTREGVATFDSVEIIQHDSTPEILFETESNKLCSLQMEGDIFSISLFDNDDDNGISLFELSRYTESSTGKIVDIDGLNLKLGNGELGDKNNFTIQIGEEKKKSLVMIF